MIVRQCAYDHNVAIHKNNKPNLIKTILMADGSESSITYPDSKGYFLWVDGEIIKKSDSFKTIEVAYIEECAKKHSNGHGHIDLIKHKLLNNKVVNK